MSSTEIGDDTQFDSKSALQVAFQTMKERCQQLQNRLTTVEKENISLKLECDKNSHDVKFDIEKSDEQKLIQNLQAKVEEVTKQKAQLTHHIFMVASENRQLWNRLTKLTHANKSLGNQLTNIMDTLKKHPPMDPTEIMSYSFKAGSNVDNEMNKAYPSSKDSSKKELSLEEISLKLINSIMLEKSELEQQYAEMVKFQSSAPLNLQNVGFTYPDDLDNNSLEHLKQHEMKLSQTKEMLLAQQEKLKKTLKNMQRMRKETSCLQWLNDSSVKLSRVERQNRASQTSLPVNNHVDKHKDTEEDHICPLCSKVFEASKSFEVFQEHVLAHFTN